MEDKTTNKKLFLIILVILFTLTSISLVNAATSITYSECSRDCYYNIFGSCNTGYSMTSTQCKSDFWGIVAGTFIALSDGTEKPIEDIKVGDVVLSYDEETQTNVPSKVEKTFYTSKEQSKGYFIINNRLRITPTHHVFVNNKWQETQNANIGDTLRLKNGNNLMISSIERAYDKMPSYNLEIENTHTYYAENVLVHNICFYSGDCECDILDGCCSGYTKTSITCQKKNVFGVWQTGTKCVKDSATTCSDTDGGIDSSTYGVCTVTSGCGQVIDSQADRCRNPTLLGEIYCLDNNEIFGTSVSIPGYICEGGVLVKEPEEPIPCTNAQKIFEKYPFLTNRYDRSQCSGQVSCSCLDSFQTAMGYYPNENFPVIPYCYTSGNVCYLGIKGTDCTGADDPPIDDPPIDDPCTCSEWKPQNCGDGPDLDCPPNERYQLRVCPGDCDVEKQCIPDPLCGTAPPCDDCTAWEGDECGGWNCAENAIYRTRTCNHPECDVNDCVIDPSCEATPPSSCSCGSWNNGGCGGGTCVDDKMYQTRSCIPSGCKTEKQCISDPVCECECGDGKCSEGEPCYEGYTPDKQEEENYCSEDCGPTYTLNCPVVKLDWSKSNFLTEYYETVTLFNIASSYDNNFDKTVHGPCKEVRTPLMKYSYDLRLSECTEHLQSNIRFLITNDKGLEPILMDWIDVSSCNLGGGPPGGEGEGEGEHNADNTGTKDDYDEDTKLNDEDDDMDGDGVPNNADDEGGSFDDDKWTPLKCAVDDHGVAIDKDEDGLCKGRDDLDYGDCNDNDRNITISYPDCTEEILCSDGIQNQGEDGIDCGGPCYPCKINITLDKPKYGISIESPFDLVISTNYNAECKFSLDVVLEYEYIMQEFSSSGTKTHTRTDFNIDNENEHKLYVKCDDGSWDPEKNTLGVFEIGVDSSDPIIETAYAGKDKQGNIIEKPLETMIVVGTDDKTICKYSTTSQEYSSMENKFPGFDEHEFKKAHNSETIKFDDDTTKEYTYYIACENRAGGVSDPEDIIIRIALNDDLTITSTTPEYVNELSAYLSITTNKNAQCYYNNISTDITANSFGASAYEHKKLLGDKDLKEGQNEFYVKCLKGETNAVKKITINVDTSSVETPVVNDTSSIEEFPEYSYHTDKLRVKWVLEEKPASGIDYYSYMLEDESSNIIVNWTESTEEDEWVWVDEDHNGDELNLTNGTEYFFNVKAKSKVGTSSEIEKSDGVIVDPSKKPASCSNGVKDGDETDTDCGGSVCTQCDLTNKCVEDSDCHSDFCNSSNMCAKPSCSDNVKNGDETDTDCGGDCGKCEIGEDCKKNFDCESGECDFNLKMCIGVDKCSNNRFDSDKETDVDCGGDCAEQKDKRCDDGQNCREDSDCESNNCLNGKCTVSVKDSDGDGIPDSTDNCPYVSNKFQENNDGDEEGDACDTDNDNDGMPDDWEEEYGLDISLDDADDDADDDGLTNLDEYEYKTDPTNPDSDNDGVSDGKEVEKGFDPTDSDSRPASVFPIIILIIGIILLVSGIGYLLYKNFTKPKQKKPFKPTTSSSVVRSKPLMNPLTQGGIKSIEFRRRQAIQKIMKDRERFKAHDKVFGTFAAQPKTGIRERLHGRLDIGKPKITKTPKKTKTKTTKKKEKKPKDVFEKLSIVATAELKKYNKKTKKK